MTSLYDSKKLYHLTSIDNLEKIILSKGLKSHKFLHNNDMDYTNIAYNHVQDKRSTINIVCGPQGDLHQYVPFYFATKSPMLFTLMKGNVDHYRKEQRDLIYIVTSIKKIRELSLPFVFSDGHGIMKYTKFFDKLEDLCYVDWEVMDLQYWNDTEEFPDRKRKRSAEFLVYNECPWDAFLGIAVMDEQMKIYVEQILSNFKVSSFVGIKNDWYF